MSREQVQAFYDKVESDGSLQQHLKAIERETVDKDALEKAIDKIIDIAKNAGFIFTKQDFINAVSEKVVRGQSGHEEKETSRSCWVTWEWDDCYAAWSSPPPSGPCGQGTSFVPPGYEPGDEDRD